MGRLDAAYPALTGMGKREGLVNFIKAFSFLITTKLIIIL
jgi:hypothetical protein